MAIESGLNITKLDYYDSLVNDQRQVEPTNSSDKEYRKIVAQYFCSPYF